MTTPLAGLTGNPLASPSTLPYELPDFSAIEASHYPPAARAAMASQLAAIEALSADPAPPTIASTLEAWDASGRDLSRIVCLLQLQVSADCSDELERVEAELAPELAAHHDAIYMNAAAYARLSALRDRAPELAAQGTPLTAQDEWYLSRILRDFRRSGVDLDEEHQARLRQVNEELSALETNFSRTVVAATNAGAVPVSDAEQLHGLPEDLRERLRDPDGAGWTVELILPTQQPVLEPLTDRALRERIQRSAETRGQGLNGAPDTRQLITQIVRLRAEQARLLGFPNHAAFEAEGQTIGSVDRINELLDRLTPPAVAAARREGREIAALLASDNAGNDGNGGRNGVSADSQSGNHRASEASSTGGNHRGSDAAGTGGNDRASEASSTGGNHRGSEASSTGESTAASAEAGLESVSDASPQLRASDWSYYAARVRRERFEVDFAEMRPYLELETVVRDGVFFAARELFGISFVERTDLAGYNPDVRVFEVFDSPTPGTPDEGLGLFLADWYTRPTKEGGAWMENLIYQNHLLGQRPIVANNLNFVKPAAGSPTLLTWDEVITLFHEFGHALHGLLSDVKYLACSGPEVPQDFVEYPSQVNEMWAWEPAVLANYAKHWQTGAAMPREWIDRLIAARRYGEGFGTTEYLAAAQLDQAWHQLSEDECPVTPAEVTAFEQAALAEAEIDYDPVPPRYRSTYFGHIFEGHYSARYYSYIFSEILDAETVQWYSENGGLTRENGERFRREILAIGGSLDPLAAFRRFRGRDARIEPLLARRGLDS
ncbi:M3 family metallopeptidase [Rarobacter faecitabidus]|uniref:Peptidase M3-like protein n=1 Tax=Rarobacter faecitabidus TaxID=13243 RepID=A0A542ZA75_RARFA|nr:M3 family metallopeptidase [Rarobacter faecitabidus]TQL57226.1 peptidase M3-like protein [Rarobacter faecitabidus]